MPQDGAAPAPQATEADLRPSVAGPPGGGADRRGRPSDSDSGSMAGQDDVALAMGRLARDLQSRPDAGSTVDRLVKAAVDAVPGADVGGLTEVRRRGQDLDVRYATDPVAAELDRTQYRLGEGPCVDAAYQHRTVRIEDFAIEQRWPRFAAAARDHGIGSMLCLQLYVQDEDLGALTLYAREPHSFDDESEHIGLLFATHAAVAMIGARTEQQLRTGMDGRNIIGQAMGILMERHDITADQAFQILVSVARSNHTKLRDLAETLALTRSLPPIRPSARRTGNRAG